MADSPRKVIVLVISNLEFGGAQRQVIELANGLDASAFDVHVVSLSEYVPLGESLANCAYRLHVLAKRWKFDLGLIKRLGDLLRSLRADVVYGFLFDAVIASGLAGRLAGTKVVIGSERNTDYVLKFRQRMVYRLTRPCFDLMIANSNAGARFNSQAIGLDISKYRVVHNGVDTKRFTMRDATSVRSDWGIATNELIVGMFASFKQQKNHEMFFRAARLVSDRVPFARFLLVGDELHAGMHGSSEYKREMMRLVDELDLRSRCIFLGNRPDVEVLYPACDVTALPSHFEGTPNVLLESMACGVPVIATDVSDNAIVAPDDEVGFIVRAGDVRGFADRMIGILTDSAQRKKMAERARQWVEQEFSIAKLVKKTQGILDEALSDASAKKTKGSNPNQTAATEERKERVLV